MLTSYAGLRTVLGDQRNLGIDRGLVTNRGKPRVVAQLKSVEESTLRESMTRSNSGQSQSVLI
eukprot:9132094-Pyramimonas_sp.AAC.1